MSAVSRLALIVLVLTLGRVSPAGQPYISDEKALDLARLLPEPPGENCPETKAELEMIVHCQKACTPPEIARIGTQARLTAMNFQDVLGPWFNEEKLPQTMALLQRIGREGKHCCDLAKQHFGRRRPRFLNPQIKPFIEGLDEPCYPSGHAVQATVLASVLSELAPEHRAALMERAREIGWNRIPAGFHYPSDCIAGRVLGQAVAQAILANADFQEELAKARREFDEVKKDAPPAGASCR